MEPNSIDATITGIGVTSDDGDNISCLITGNATFNNAAYNQGTVTGNATFSGTATNRGTVTGNATFTYLTAASGLVTDTTGYANGKVGGATYDSVGATITTWVFSTKNNSGTVTGNATFSSNKQNQGTVTGNATFSGTATNRGTVTGNATFTYLTAASGLVTDTTGYANGKVGGATYDSVGATITTWVFSTKNNSGTVTGNATFSGGKYNSGTVTGNATFSNTSSNGGTVGGNATFSNAAYNQGTVTGNATFNNGASNGANVGGNATFYNTAYNLGTVNGTVTFNDSPNPTMLKFGDVSRVINLGDPASFSFTMFNHAGISCPSCTYTIATNPSVPIISPTKSSNQVTGSFTPTRLGTYSLMVTVSDPADGSSAVWNDLFFVIQPETTITTSQLPRYYLRSSPPANNAIRGIPGDVGSLTFSQPQSTETRACGTWVQDSLDELPVNIPIQSLLSELHMHVMHDMTGSGNMGIQRFSSYDSTNYDKQEPISGSGAYIPADLTFQNLNWDMNSPSYLYALGIKVTGANGSGMAWQSGPSNLSYVDINYEYATTPLVQTTSQTNSDILLLSATVPTSDINDATIVLKNPSSGSASTTIKLGDSTHNFRRPFQGYNTTINSDGTATVAATGITGVTTVNSVPLDITPSAGTIAVNIDTWNTSGDYAKEWTESGSTHGITTVHSVGNLSPNTSYLVKVDNVLGTGITGPNCTNGVCLSDANGTITFTYSGGYSSHDFDVSLDITPPTGAAITSITATSTMQLTVTAAATDTGSGLNATPYQFQRTGVTASSWQTSPLVDAGLSPNTRYGYRVQARDANGNTSAYSATSSGYTLAPAPTHFAAATATTTSITLSVDGFPNSASGSSAYAFARTGGDDSGWITMNGWTDSGLSCGSTYTYTVKYRNGDGIETDHVSLTASTSACPVTSSNSSNSSSSSSVSQESGGGRHSILPSLLLSLSSSSSAGNSRVSSTSSASSLPSLQQRILDRLAARKAKRLNAVSQLKVAPSAPSLSSPTYRVKVPLLNLRADARITALIKGVLKEGASLSVLRFVQQNQWAQVRLSDGRTGYVYAPSLKKAEQ